MKEERLKILEMLQEGKITTEEAMALLKQVQGENEEDRHQARGHGKRKWHVYGESGDGHRNSQENGRRHRMPNIDLSWINDLGSVIENVVEEAVKTVSFTDDFFTGASQEKYAASLNIINGIRSLTFEGKNAPVKLETYDGDMIKVEASYKAKNYWNPHLSLTEDNGNYRLSYDDNALYMLGMNIYVPETVNIGKVCLKNKNASIFVNNITADKIELNTKHRSISVTNTKGECLYCETKNASILLEDVNVREVDAQTSNSKISMEHVTAFNARAVTNSAKIDVNNSSIIHLYAKTSDSPLQFENLGFDEHEPACSIDAITTNGHIAVYLPNEDIQCRLSASTTFGGIFNELKNMEFHANENNYVNAQSEDYETAQHKLNLNLQTTNFGIHVK